tara:strand:+ start:211 stop:774 length:564 start_codon:yes stop_codon:yes gene_type:complete
MSYIGSKRSSSLVSFDEGTIGSGVVFPAGHVIKIEQTIVSGAQTVTTGNSWGTAISVSIQTTKANSKILVIPNVYFGLLYDEGYNGAARIIRNYPSNSTLAIGSTTIHSTTNTVGHYHISDSENTRWQQSMSLIIRDTPNAPAGTTIEYKIQATILGGNGGEAIYMNRWALNGDLSGVSTLTVMETS